MTLSAGYVCICEGGTENEADQFVTGEDLMLNQYASAASTHTRVVGLVRLSVTSPLPHTNTLTCKQYWKY